MAPKTLETVLLDAYHRDTSTTTPGALLRESQVPLPGGRRLDGLFLPGVEPTEEFAIAIEQLSAFAAAQVIEVKSGLSEEVLGQVLVGLEMLRANHPSLTNLEPVVVCEEASPDMLEVAAAHNVRVWSPDDAHLRTKPEDYMRSRAPLLWRPRWVEAVEPLRQRSPTLFFTEVPLGATNVNLLRVPSDVDLLAKFETKARFLARVQGLPVELIEVRKKPRRGVAGRLLAHKHLLKKHYGLEVSTLRVIVPEPDADLQPAFATLGVILGTPEQHAAMLGDD